MNGYEARKWKRAAMAGAGVAGLLAARLWAAWPPVGLVKNFLGETLDEEIIRRLKACEASVQELWKAHNRGDLGDG